MTTDNNDDGDSMVVVVLLLGCAGFVAIAIIVDVLWVLL